MPAQINTATVGQRLVALFGLKGRFQPVLDEVVVPVVNVDAGTIDQVSCAASAYQAGAASNYNFSYLQNPSTSTKIIRVQRIEFLPGSTAEIFTLITSVAPVISGGGTNGTEYFLDQRAGAPVGVWVHGSSTTDVSGAAAVQEGRQTGGPQPDFPTPIALMPGDTLQATSLGTNKSAWWTWFWTEEPITVTLP